MSMTIQEAIRALHLPGDHLKNYDEYGIYIDDELKEAMQMAISSLREKAERDNPNPLTLEELKQMVGEPVWLVWPDGRIHSEWWLVGNNNWLMMEFNDQTMEQKYGKTWTAYRHKPKEV